MDIVTITARDLPEAWFLAIRKCLEPDVYEYTIEKGSFEGHKRKEFDLFVARIENPGSKPIVPDVPDGVPPPASLSQVEEYYKNYLLCEDKKVNEIYTYGEDIGYQLQGVLDNYSKGFETNTACITVGSKESIYYEHSQCLRLIDTRIRYGKLHFVVYFRSWDLFCVSEDTEILTKNGWKNIETIDESDYIGSVDFNTGNMVYIPNVGIHRYKYNDDMVSIRNKRTDQLVTPNHRVLLQQVGHSGSKYKLTPFHYKEAGNLSIGRGINLPLAGGLYIGSKTIGVELAKLVGWIISEGNFGSYNISSSGISIYQSMSNEQYVTEINNILDNLDISYSRRTSKKGGYSDGIEFYIKAGEFTKMIRRIIPNKKPTIELLELIWQERIALFNSLMKGDGSRRGNIFWQKDSATRDWFRLLCLSLGFATSENAGRISVGVNSRKSTQLRKEYDSVIERVPYVGWVWSVTVPTGNYFARRNGKIFLTGNSGFPVNLGGIQLLKEQLASALNVGDGEILAISKGLHLYDFQYEVAKMAVGLDENALVDRDPIFPEPREEKFLDNTLKEFYRKRGIEC